MENFVFQRLERTDRSSSFLPCKPMIASRFASDLIGILQSESVPEKTDQRSREHPVRLQAMIVTRTPGDVNIVLIVNFQINQNPVPKLLGLTCLYENPGCLPLRLVHDNVRQIDLQIFDQTTLTCRIEIQKIPFQETTLCKVEQDGLIHQKVFTEYGETYVTRLKETEAKPIIILFPPEIYSYQGTKLVCLIKLDQPACLIQVEPLEEPIGC